MKFIVLIGLLACVALTKHANDIEQAQELLLELKNEIHDQILALDREWELTQKAKQSSIQSLKQTKVEQVADCDRRDQNVINKQTDIQEMTDFIAWIQHRIIVNKNRIQTIEDLQCRQSLNFIDTVRDDKISLTVSIFVKEQLEKIVSEGTSFTQKSQAMHNILSFLQDIKDNKYELLELQRTMEIEREENPSFVEMGPIEMKKFQEVRNEILTVLDELEAEINSHIPVAQADMIRVGLAYLEWKQRILKENEFFEEKVVELGKQLEHLQDQLVALEYSASQCQERVVDIDRAVEVAKNDAFLSFDQYTNEHDRLMQQLAFFAEIFKLYNREIDNKTTAAEKEALTEEAHPIVGGDPHSHSPQPVATAVEEVNEEQESESETEVTEESSEESVEESQEEVTEEVTGEEEPEPVDVPELEETDEQQQALIKKGPLKLREVEPEPSYKRSDFILLQMKKKRHDQDEVIL